MAFPKRSLPIAARNLLQTSGLNCARCSTSPTGKQLLTTLRRTVRSKDCTAASRMPFAHAPLMRLGLRSYPLCSSDSEHVPAVSLPRHNSSAVLPVELPGDLLSAPLVWVRRGGVIPPLQPLYDGPYTVLRRGPRSFTPLPSESGPETRSSPSAASRPVRPQTPCLAARVAAADRRVRTQVVLPQPSESRFQTRWFLHLPLRRRHETVPEPFSYPARRFLHALDRRRLHRCHIRSTCPVNGHRQRG